MLGFCFWGWLDFCWPRLGCWYCSDFICCCWLLLFGDGLTVAALGEQVGGECDETALGDCLRLLLGQRQAGAEPEGCGHWRAAQLAFVWVDAEMAGGGVLHVCWHGERHLRLRAAEGGYFEQSEVLGIENGGWRIEGVARFACLLDGILGCGYFVV